MSCPDLVHFIGCHLLQVVQLLVMLGPSSKQIRIGLVSCRLQVTVSLLPSACQDFLELLRLRSLLFQLDCQVLIVAKQAVNVFLGVFEVFDNEVALDLQILGSHNRVLLQTQLLLLRGNLLVQITDEVFQVLLAAQAILQRFILRAQIVKLVIMLFGRHLLLLATCLD